MKDLFCKHCMSQKRADGKKTNILLKIKPESKGKYRNIEYKGKST